MSTKQRCVHRSKTCSQTLKHFENVFATGGNNIVAEIASSYDVYSPPGIGVNGKNSNLLLSFHKIAKINIRQKNIPIALSQ